MDYPGYPEFHDPEILSNTLSLFENNSLIRTLLNHSFNEEKTKFWVGDDLRDFTEAPHLASLIAVPYRIGQKTVGVLAALGPDRLQYGKVFALLQTASYYISENLTKSLYKFKLTYRQQKLKSLDINLVGSNILRLNHESQNG